MPRDDISTAELHSDQTRTSGAVTPQPTLIAQLATELRRCWQAADEIDERHFAAPADGFEEGRRERSAWDRRGKEVWRRKEALQAAIAALPAENMTDALTQLTIAFALVEMFGDNHADEGNAKEDRLQAEFLIASARRVMLREAGLEAGDLGMRGYMSEGVVYGAPLDELLAAVKPLRERGAA